MKSIIVESAGPVLHIKLNSPGRLNALDLGQHESIRDALLTAEARDEVRVVVISGAGRAFCAGDHIKAGGAGALPRRLQHRAVDLAIGTGPLLLLEVTSILRRLTKPTLALLHGYAVGAGFDYACACDFRLATTDCIIGDPRMKLALWGAEGGSYMVPRLQGQAFLSGTTYLGQTLNGAAAAKCGFVHKIIAAPTLDDGVVAGFCMRLAELPEEAFRQQKMRMLMGVDGSFEQCFRC